MAAASLIATVARQRQIDILDRTKSCANADRISSTTVIEVDFTLPSMTCSNVMNFILSQICAAQSKIAVKPDVDFASAETLEIADHEANCSGFHNA